MAQYYPDILSLEISSPCYLSKVLELEFGLLLLGLWLGLGLGHDCEWVLSHVKGCEWVLNHVFG